MPPPPVVLFTLPVPLLPFPLTTTPAIIALVGFPIPMLSFRSAGASPRNRVAASGAATAKRECECCREEEVLGSGFTIRQVRKVRSVIGNSAGRVIGGILWK
ncbi:hypothetical protein BDD12DRAFT_868884 [Trichophaea hybrida]|nr:hypothetical protein BDD12DRAFT_868884 [Trichophaea hybrida]